MNDVRQASKSVSSFEAFWDRLEAHTFLSVNRNLGSDSVAVLTSERSEFPVLSGIYVHQFA
jgi:hypothetical protein